ncbi:uncharacterized protein [Diadema setosum]|uniref:uncharacterized protein n=1 Tax=Diadema setosum TaxID=31175 RepID=UPI003B3A0360
MGRNLMVVCLLAVLFNHHIEKCMAIQSTPTNASCEAKCTYSEVTRHADCENRQLTEVPMECNTATYLSLSNNQIERIDPGTFEAFTNLQGLTLSNNKIRQVEAITFSGAPKLKKIYLYSNNIEIFDLNALNGSNSDLQDIDLSNNNINDIESGTFQFVKKLEFIDLYNNSLSRLNPGVFDNLRHLEILDLGSNKLKTLPNDIFAHLSRLETIILADNQLISTGRVLLLPLITSLDMRNNNLTRLENQTEEALGRLEFFLLEGNPLNCDCQLETLRLWYSRLKSKGDRRTNVDSPTCYEPSFLAKKPINEVREGFCLHSNFFSTTFTPKSTKGSPDEINNFTLPFTSKPKSPGKSNLKVIIPVPIIILTVVLVCVLCALKYREWILATMGRNFMIICLVALLTPTNASCDAKCTYSETTREADCDYRQLSELPMECNAASYLSLSHNQIERIEPGTFQGFSNLEVLILSNNKIRQVEASTFTGALKLQLIHLQRNNLEIFDRLALNGTNMDLGGINLSHNNIKDIETDTFQHVIKLRFIVLYNNSLSCLRSGVFDNLRQLTSLRLGRNKLKTLENDLFRDFNQLQTIILSDNQLISTGNILLLPQITTLDMRNNNLTRLENLTEETLGRLQVFLLEGNPWICDCQLETLRLWYSRLHLQGYYRIINIDSPTCYEPLFLAKQTIQEIMEGFCLHSNLSSTTNSPKSTKGSPDEIKSTTSPDTSKPKSPDKNYLKGIVPIMLLLLAVTAVYISRALKQKCNWNCKYDSLGSHTTDIRQPIGTHHESAPLNEQQINEKKLV